MFQNLLLKKIFSWYILCRDEDIVFLCILQYFQSLLYVFKCSFQNTIREHLKNISNLF